MGNRGTRASPPTSTLSHSTRCKVALVWVKRSSPLYGLLSTNVLREVCHFFVCPQLLSIWDGGELVVFSIWRKTFRVINLKQFDMLGNYHIAGECVCIEDDRFFLCGGMRIAPFAKSSSIIVCVASAFMVCTDKLRILSNMQRERYLHGLYYHEASGCVFAFAGAHSRLQVTKSCEQYQLSTNLWSPLPDMNARKTIISTCGYLGTVYLAGDKSSHLELFTIASKHFTAVPIQIEKTEKGDALVVWKGKLVVFHQNKVETFESSTYALVEELTIPNLRFRKSPVVVNNELYSLDLDRCFSFNLETMKVSFEYHQDKDS